MNSEIRRKFGLFEEERFFFSSGEKLPVPITFPNHRFLLDQSILDAKLEPVEKWQRDIAVARLHKVLKSCQGSGLSRCVKSIIAARSLNSEGIELGGLAVGSRIYLAVSHGDSVLWEEELAQVFFHELGHAVLNQVDAWLVKLRWKKLLPKGFKYRSTGFDAVRSGHADPCFSKDWLEHGFISQYSATSFDEDFCMIAQHLFVGTRDFWLAADEFPAILQRIRIVLEVYRSLGFKITEEVARSYVERSF